MNRRIFKNHNINFQIDDYIGDAGDAWTEGHHAGMKFSTFDNDNGPYKPKCAEMYKGKPTPIVKQVLQPTGK